MLHKPIQQCPNSEGRFFYNYETNQLTPLRCNRRICPVCGPAWSSDWRDLLAGNELIYKDDKALTLTSACDPGYMAFWLALKLFWRHIRTYTPRRIDRRTGELLFKKCNLETGKVKWLPPSTRRTKEGYWRNVRPFQNIEYFGVVEYNQKHTQPHFHFVLRSRFIPQPLIRWAWKAAQREAGFEAIAFDVRIEQIKKTVAKYFAKYITKAAGFKDELPRPEDWHGRGVRYSKKFFCKPTPHMRAGDKFRRKAIRGDFSQVHAIVSRTRTVKEQMLEFCQLEAEYIAFARRAWSPGSDRAKVETVLPIDIVQEECYSYIQFVPLTS